MGRLIDWLSALLSGGGQEVTCDHEDHSPIGFKSLRENDRLFYKIYDRPSSDRTYWCENNGVYVKLQPWEYKYVCTMCGAVFEAETAERVGGEDGILRKADGRPDEDVSCGGYRRGMCWYEDNKEAIQEKYYR